MKKQILAVISAIAIIFTSMCYSASAMSVNNTGNRQIRYLTGTQVYVLAEHFITNNIGHND